MAKQKTTTKSTKRYRYSSFKDKIDDLRIEPAKNLDKRVHEYVESSHFLSSFEHWKEFNLSGGFINFAREINDLVQTLPQILYHAEKIFDTLVENIGKHDDKSLQPLLDLLSQFCHDLGPDFLKFYERALTTIIDLLDEAISFENSSVFEWGFNCLAYMFKYLTRYLSQDLLPTFNLLFPLLSHKKEYMSRFSAEALSYLIRKMSSTNLFNFVEYAMGKLVDTESNNFYDGLQTLFSESLKSTSESLHSKSGTIVDTLLKVLLKKELHAVTVSLFSDVFMDISRHASAENIAQLYELILGKLSHYMEQESESADLDKISKVLSVLAFAESGRKVPSWDTLTECVKMVLNHQNKDSMLPETTSFMFAVIIRNSNVRTLTSFHKLACEYYLERYPSHFTEFFKLLLDSDSDKVISFNMIKFLQKFINNHWQDSQMKLALFFLHLIEKPGLEEKLHISIPAQFTNQLLDDLNQFKNVMESDVLIQIYWRILIIKRSTVNNHPSLKSLAERLLSISSPNDFTKDVVGNLLFFVFSTAQSEENLLSQVVGSFCKFHDSTLFIEGVNHIISSGRLSPHLLFDNQEIMSSVTDNLLLPDRNIRAASLRLIMKMYSAYGNPTPQIINDLSIIEEIPLTFDNGRDITTRIRKLGSDFSKLKPGKLVCEIFFKHLFGLLTVRFSPIWDGITEILPQVYEKDQRLVWCLMLHLIRILDNNSPADYSGIQCAISDRDVFWKVSINRLNDSIQAADNIFELYHSLDSSFNDILTRNRVNKEYPGMIRNQALKLLLLLPSLAEKNSRDIVPLLLNSDSSDFVDIEEPEKTYTSSTWSENDRNLLLKIFGKFKNIKAIYKSEEVRERLLILLGSRTIEAQKLALGGILCYKDPVLVKYRDNLENLLDDALFKDEMTKLLATDEARMIDGSSEARLMPLVLRILFGRVQTPNTSGIKKSRKASVITVLPGFKEMYVAEFLALGCKRFNFTYFFENSGKIDPNEATVSVLRRMVGFVNVVGSSVTVLGSKFPRAIETIIKPLIYTMCMSTYVVEQGMVANNIDKIAATLRQQAMKCFYNIFEQLGDVLDWAPLTAVIYENVIMPRIPNFEHENLQQPSSIMKIMTYWTKFRSLYKFLYYDNYSAVLQLSNVLANVNAKESVVAVILDAFNNIIKNPVKEDEYVELVVLVASTSLYALPALLERLSDQNVLSIVIDLLFNVTEGGYIQGDDTRRQFVSSLVSFLEKDISILKANDKEKIFSSLAFLVTSFNCTWKEIEPLYLVSSKYYSTFQEKSLRQSLNKLFSSIALRFGEIEQVAELLTALNSYSTSRIQEYDFGLILPAFKVFMDSQYKSFNERQWLPIIYCMLYFINDKNELAIRTNASHTLNRFVDYMNTKTSLEDAKGCAAVIEEILMPHIKLGLRKATEEIQSEYITVLSYIIANAKYFKELDDAKVLLFNDDEEANFFTNINHIQLHRRQRAIKRLGQISHQLSPNTISQYMVPMIEHYVFCHEEKYRNVCNEAIATIGILSNHITWNQYKALLRRYIALLKSKQSHLKEIVSVIINITSSFKNSAESQKNFDENKPSIVKFPKNSEEPTQYVKAEIYPVLHKILSHRDEETIVARIPLSQALVNLILGLSQEDTISLLPGILINTCQVLRSSSEELREAVRKNLSSIATSLGPEYVSYIIRELKSALSRGSQIHVLSYTVHYLLMSISKTLNHGDLDDSAQLIVNIIMEDMFGTSGQEKEAEGYVSKMKEVKFNKSFDTGEILAANISLSKFAVLLRPVKAVLQENLSLKNQRKLDELLRRYSLGLNHNEEASSPDVLILCHEIYMQSLSDRSSMKSLKGKELSENAEFFLIDLKAKNTVVQAENSHYAFTLQKFSLDILKTVLSRHSNLLQTNYLNGFMALLKEALTSENEAVVISAMRLLIIIMKLEFAEEYEEIFKSCARNVLNFVKDSPSTSSELCQTGLKFLSSLIKYKDIKLKETALDYILGRIQPDLMESSKQGLAFAFLKSLLSKHVMLPKLYDIFDAVAEIMVTNHAKEIRDVARSVYFQFLMEYDQSKGRLEKQFKFLVNNLQYPSQEGRQSVMELLNLIINKSGPELLMKLSSSFFVVLANVVLNDDSPKCRKMATLLLTNLFKKLGPKNMVTIEKYILAWLKQIENPLFITLGLRIYKIYLTVFDDGVKSLHEIAVARIKSIIADTEVGSESKWEDVYTALETFAVYVEKKKESVYLNNFNSTWDNIIGCLLYPHEWVRLSSSRLVNVLLDNKDSLETPLNDYKIQTIAYRSFRVLGAPSGTKDVGSKQSSVKVLVSIIMKWNANYTPFILKNNDEENQYEDALDFAVSRTAGIIRSEDNPADSSASKLAAIQLLAMIIQILDNEQLKKYAEKIILPLYTFVETGDIKEIREEDNELVNKAQECMDILESKLSVSDFTSAYSNVKQLVSQRRFDRRARRANLALNAPAVAAERKLKKHLRSRQKRKHEKDENGYYQRKNKKKRV
ncbi:HEL005Wp [Eremothecium sinecaudum]|uniref:HEL005Wp n=1 Tax=Eremothecium sinecaudum TaxID=45286 RepID=A0A0X8HTS3_9SACH|nr:HEL005Wp [Eremothecium sinecaudum]AMD21275.1 HEL005Wp [Eremothecium sinecaudum]